MSRRNTGPKYQIALAELYGYAESRGDEDLGLRRGDLVPYDHYTTTIPATTVEKLKKRGVPVGVIAPSEDT